MKKTRKKEPVRTPSDPAGQSLLKDGETAQFRENAQRRALRLPAEKESPCPLSRTSRYRARRSARGLERRRLPPEEGSAGGGRLPSVYNGSLIIKTGTGKRPSRLSSHPGRGIGAAQLSAKRRLIRQAGPGQYPCHQPVERGGMIGMDPMAKLMDHHIRRAVRRGQDKSGVQRQPVPPGRAAPPSRAHPSQSQEGAPSVRPVSASIHRRSGAEAPSASVRRGPAAPAAAPPGPLLSPHPGTVRPEDAG